jgi:hypothetical protein
MKRCLKKLKTVRFDTEPLAPPLEGTLDPISNPRPTDWDTLSPYSPKSILRIDLRCLLSHPDLESITCVAADRKYTNIIVDMDAEDMDSEDMNEGDLNEEDLDEEGLNEGGLLAQVLNEEEDEEEEEEEEEEEFGPIEQPCKNLTSLSFERSRLSQSTLGKILDAAPRLQKLKYEFWIHTSVMGEFISILIARRWIPSCNRCEIHCKNYRSTLTTSRPLLKVSPGGSVDP